jgi:hypothetical protein
MSTTHRDSYSDEADAEHMRFCENDPSGPTHKVLERMEKVEKRVSAIEEGRAQERGASEAMAKSNVRTVQILASLSALSTIVGFVLNHWQHR